MITDIIQQSIEAVIQSWFAALLLCGLAFAVVGALAGRRRE